MKIKYTIAALDDHVDGNAYISNIAHAHCLTDCYAAPLSILQHHDYVCILLTEVYEAERPTDIEEFSRYSLIITAGSDFPLSENVNKL